MSFANPLYLALIFLIVPILWWGHYRRKTVGHTQVGLHKNVRTIPLIGWLPIALVALLWTAFAIGMAGPRKTTYADQTVVDTRDIVIMVDVSGSMSTALKNKDQQDFVHQSTAPAPGGAAPPEQKQPTRANAARQGVNLFVNQRKGDRIAVLLFDDEVYTACLFTFSQDILNKKLPLIDQYNGGGTNFDGPNPDNPYSKVGAIQGAINFFKQSGQAKTKVLIMVTDGEDSISQKRFGELSDQIESMGIHMYVLGVGESWTGGTMVDLRKFAEGVGGKVFLIGDPQAMKDGFAEINRLEKSKIVVERVQDYKPLYWLVLIPAAGFVLLFLFVAMIVREED